MLNNVINFVETHRGRVIPFEKILETYRENTDVYVAELIERTIMERLIARGMAPQEVVRIVEVENVQL